MNEIVNAQTLLFVRAIEIGILLGMFYDLIRIFRKIIPHVNWVVQIEDILYWLVCTVIAFGVFYIHNFADIRFFVFIGMILGGIFYLCTFSIVFMKIATWFIELMRKVITYIIKMLLIPIRAAIAMIKIPLKMIERQLIRWRKYQIGQVRKARRKWYYKTADLKSGIRLKSTKNIYNSKKRD